MHILTGRLVFVGAKAEGVEVNACSGLTLQVFIGLHLIEVSTCRIELYTVVS